MDKLGQLIHELKETARHPKKSVIRAMEETGKKAVGCFPIYTPEELVYAAKALPIGMWGGPTKGTLSDRYLQVFCCSVMKANTEQALLKQYDLLSAVIMTTYCDTLKCIVENWKVASPELNIIPMVYPQNKKTAPGKNFLSEELIRVKGILETILAVKISDKDIEESIDLYDEYRRIMNQFVETIPQYPDIFDATTRHLIIKAGYFMDKKQYSKNIKEILQLLEEREPRKPLVKKVILSGLIAEPEELLQLFTANGLQVVGDDLAHETRQFRTLGPSSGSWTERMTERIAEQDGCAFLFDENKSRGQRLIKMSKLYRADAIVIVQMKFCDPEEFDYPIIKTELEHEKIPVLYLEIEQQMDSVEQLRTRIQSFAEMLG